MNAPMSIPGNRPDGRDTTWFLATRRNGRWIFSRAYQTAAEAARANLTGFAGTAPPDLTTPPTVNKP